MLFAEVIARAGRARLRVYGSSMLPAIWPGDLILAESCRPEEMRAGDLVVLRRGQRLLLHRVLTAPGTGQLLITRGDCLSYPDPAATTDQILGTVVRIQRGAREWAPSRQLRWSERLLARLLSGDGWGSRQFYRLHARWRQACGCAANVEASIPASERI
jgi:signal peptidase